MELLLLTSELHPDVVVMDLSLPELHGTEAIKRIREGGSDTKVVVLSMHSSPAVVQRAREAGCHGYVVKGADVSELARAIRGALVNQPYYSSEVVDAASASNPIDRLVLDRRSDRSRVFRISGLSDPWRGRSETGSQRAGLGFR